MENCNCRKMSPFPSHPACCMSASKKEYVHSVGGFSIQPATEKTKAFILDVKAWVCLYRYAAADGVYVKGCLS